MHAQPVAAIQAASRKQLCGSITARIEFTKRIRTALKLKGDRIPAAQQ